jgi:hypothetical protein
MRCFRKVVTQEVKATKMTISFPPLLELQPLMIGRYLQDISEEWEAARTRWGPSSRGSEIFIQSKQRYQHADE